MSRGRLPLAGLGAADAPHFAWWVAAPQRFLFGAQCLYKMMPPRCLMRYFGRMTLIGRLMPAELSPCRRRRIFLLLQSRAGAASNAHFKIRLLAFESAHTLSFHACAPLRYGDFSMPR